MEYKKNTIRNQSNSSGTSHFTESNAGHISVKTTSPFLNKKRDSEFTVTEHDHNKSKKTSGSVLNKKLPKDIASGTSKMLINQILGDGNVDRDAIINKSLNETNLNLIDATCNYDKKFALTNVEFKYSTPTLNSKSFSMQFGSCSGEDSIVPSKTSNADENHNDYSQINNASCSKMINKDKRYAEKTTYCRPARNHNLDFINKTVERNNKLHRLVKKLIDIRKKEKQTEAWNNYVNELKNRHGYGDSEQTGRYTIEESAPLEYIDDYYNTQFTSNPSNECKELLNDFYDNNYNALTPNRLRYQIDYRNQKPTSLHNYKSYLNNPNCYPMSSQGRFMMLNRERNKASFGNECLLHHQIHSSRPFYRNTIFVDKEPTRLRSSCCKVQAKKIEKTSISNKCLCSSFPSQIISTSIQTENIVEPSAPARGPDVKNTTEECTQKDHDQGENLKESYCKVSENVERLKKRIQETCNADTCRMQQNVLQSIESKLDSLLNSINSFMEEVKSKTQIDKGSDSQSVSLKHINSNNLTHMNIPVSRSDPLGLIKAERIVCGCGTQEPSKSNLSEDRKCDKMLTTNVNRLLIGDMNMRNFNSMFSGNVVNCAVQISVEIPTRERSTEVTNSLSKTVFELADKSISIEEIERNQSDGDKTITIAVNTDPLGLLALLRISTEAVKQFLSYMPNIPYHHYLSMINFPQRTEVSHYVCNICGAAFVRPSQLSDHIRLHDLGKSRDCCVCRHVLDMQRRRAPGLFRCRHCGQRFTRAYCCELHQDSCARRLGLRPDAAPSLTLLR